MRREDFPPSLSAVGRAGRRSGFSLVEVVIGTLVLAGAIIPMYFLFTGSESNIFRSRISYMALHAAREELEALRQVDPVKLPLMRHDWEPVTGSVLKRVAPTADPSGNPAPDPAAGLAPGSVLEYPEEYARIETKVDVSSAADPAGELAPPVHPRLYRVMLQVRWQEKGTSEEEGGVGHRRALSRFQTVIADHRVR